MEASIVRAESTPGELFREFARERPAAVAFGVIALIVLALVAARGLHDVAQASLNGLTLGVIYALGAVGLTLVYGILRLVNFAHGDFLTFGAYMAYLVNVTWGMPLAAGIIFAMATTALLGLFFERTMWRPMRARGAGFLQLILMSIGLAFVIRSAIQWFWGSEIRTLDVNVTDSVSFLGLRIGQTELMVVVVGLVVLIAVGLIVRFSLLGKQMRALSDDLDLAETAGIDTRRVILYTWLFAGALAGLAGVLSGALTNLRPELGFELLLPIFAAVILGGIGNPFGALTAGLVLGVVIELFNPGRRAALEGDLRLRRPDRRARDPPAGDLRPREGGMSALPHAFTLEAFTNLGFWSGVLVVAGIYAVVTLGLQLNVGYTGIINFGQAGFMAVGGYSMAILVLEAGFSFWLALPAAVLITMAFRGADRPALAAAARRLLRDRHPRHGRGGAAGRPERSRPHRRQQRPLLRVRRRQPVCFDDSWRSVSDSILGFVENFWSDPEPLLPLLLVVWATVAIGIVGLELHAGDTVGEGAAGDQGGRGRGTRSGQEHPPLQAAVAGDLGAARRPGRLLPRPLPGHDPPRRLRAHRHLLRLRGADPRRPRQLQGRRRRVRSCSGPCSKGPASSSCRSARRRRRRCASRSSARS